MHDQLGHIGSELARADSRQQINDPDSAQEALCRAIDLIDLTLGDQRWSSRLKEIARLREIVGGHYAKAELYGTTLKGLESYCTSFYLAKSIDNG